MGLDIEVCRKAEHREYCEVSYWRNRYDILEDLYKAMDVKHDNDSNDYDAITYKQVIEFQTLIRKRMEECDLEFDLAACDVFADDMQEIGKMLVTMQLHGLKHLFISAGY